MDDSIRTLGVPQLCGTVPSVERLRDLLVRPIESARAVDEYLQRDEPRIERRRTERKGWMGSPDALRERQRRSRLIRNTRPSIATPPRR